MASKVAKDTRLEPLRSCGRLETYSTSRHHLGFYNNVGLTAYYTVSTPPKTSLENIVFAALHQLIAKHPNLSAIPVDEDKSHPEARLVRIPQIDLHSCVEFHTRKRPVPTGSEPDAELDALLRKQHDHGFKNDVGSPYWRLLISSYPSLPTTFTASWMFHHALSDGSSAMLFHRAFLDALSSGADVPSAQPVVKTMSTPLLPPLEGLHPMTLTWPYFLRAIAASLLPSLFAPLPADLWTGGVIDASTHVPARTTTVVVTASTTRAFAAKCRSEKTSVTAALCALLAAVLQRGVAVGKSVKIDTPISMRPFLQIDEEAMVNAVANHTFTFQAPSSASEADSEAQQVLDWEVARKVKASLAKEVGKRGVDNPVALLKYVSNMHDFFTSKHGKARESSAEVSSLGVWNPAASPSPSAVNGEDSAREGVWTVGRMVFTQCANRTGRPVDMCAVTGGDGCLVLSFNGGMADEDGGGELVEELSKAMLKAIEDSIA